MMKRDTPAYSDGLALLDRLHGGCTGEQLVKAMRDICPDFVSMTIEWAMSGIWRGPGWIC